MMKNIKKRLLIDLDGVLNEYGKEKFDENFIPKIKNGAKEFLENLSKEYNINYVRTQYESLYFVPKVKKYITIKYPINLIKIALLNLFTISNRKIIKKYGYGE